MPFRGGRDAVFDVESPPTEIVQLIPRLAPPATGVGDYALLLAEELRRIYGLNTRFLVGDPNWRGSGRVSDFPVAKVAARTADNLSQLLARETGDRIPVLLHYVGYGFQNRGCPIWLLRGLAKWRRSMPRRRLLTVFHELYARGPIWSSSFWNFPLQRWVTAKLARVSDRCCTNMKAYANRLEQMAPQHTGRITVSPVFSTIGEPDAILPLAERSPSLVIFGGGRWLDEAATTHRAAVDRACELLGVERIITIGPCQHRKVQFSRPVEEMGVLPAADISRCLADTRVGFLNYFSGYLGKSTIFAAYCAHGLLPLFALPNYSELDGLSATRHFLVALEMAKPVAIGEMQRIADHARDWYSQHTLAQCTALITKDLQWALTA
jgi:hypothetical protein